MAVAEKDGASTTASPAVYPAEGRCTAGADNSRAKLRALAQAMGGPCIVRDADGNGYLLTVEALKFINLSHGGLSA